MKYTVESDFNKHVRSKEQHRVYLLYGTQSYLIGLYEKLLMKKAAGGEFNEFNLHRFESGTLDLQEFYDAVESLPFFSEGRCVTLDLEPDKLSANDLKELCEVLSDPPNTTCVIITVKNTPAKKEKLTQLIKTCDKVGGVIELGARNSSDTLRFLRDRAQKGGSELSSDVASYLIRRSGDDLQMLATEVDKLCAYVNGRAITKEDIDEIVAALLSARVYDLSKAIVRGDFPKSMELVDQLFSMREPASKVLAVLSGAFADLYRGFAVRQAGLSVARAAGELGYPKNREFALKNAMSDSGNYTAAQLGRMLDALCEADFQLKSSNVNERVVLEQVIAKLFLLREMK